MKTLTIDDLIAARPVPDDEFVLCSGPGFVYGDDGFHLRPKDDPLLGVLVGPVKLLKRVSEFSGGSLYSVTAYLLNRRKI